MSTSRCSTTRTRASASVRHRPGTSTRSPRPGKLRAVSPSASIIAMVRQPVDMMYAQHSQLLFNRQEEIEDFGAALAAEPARRRGERLPPGPLRPETLRYRETSRYAEQLQRYFDVFGRERVHVIVFDDFRDATSDTVRATFEFLGVDPDVPVELGARNVNKQARSAVLQRLVYRPPGPLLRLAPRLRRHPWAHRVRAWVVSRNSRTARRAPLDPALRRAAHRGVRAGDSEARGAARSSSSILAIRRRMTVLIVNAYSVRNRGDAAIVRGLIATLRQLGHDHIAVAPRGWRQTLTSGSPLGRIPSCRRS